MAHDKHYLALDLGAESGRAILGTLTNGRIELSEVHRFLTGPETLPTMYPNLLEAAEGKDTSLVWDFVRFWHEIKASIRKAAKQAKLKSIGVDTWGVDFALLDKKGHLISFPYHYRDSRTNGMMEEAFKRLPRERIYEITGIQFMQLNTLFQLVAMSSKESPLLKTADKLVMVPDLINYWLTGKVAAEFTEATTSQCFDTRNGCWSDEILSAMDIPRHIFPEIIMPGTVLGPMRRSLMEEVGCESIVIEPPTHDTGAAVCAVPARDEHFAWISSGTWSIVGMNSPKPVINEESYKNNFTNEGGIDGSFRFSKNVMGLWIIQQCRQQWKNEGKDYSYSELTDMAAKADALKTIVDPDHGDFLLMGNMVDKVIDYCRKTKQPIPTNEGELVRAVLQGLAMRYRNVVQKLEEMSGKKLSTIHIVGGGTQNQLLNQLTADAMGRKVVTGPVEATAIGNLIVQAIGNGDIANWQEGIAVIRDSFDIETYTPGDRGQWDKAYLKFKDNIDTKSLAF